MREQSPEYLSCAHTAKLVRAALKRAFPDVKFSVRSHTYSMGASINVDWTDGPAGKDVETVACAYKGAGFDGSIDLKHDLDHWLLPDGSAVVAHDPGTVGSMGAHPTINGPGAEFGEITGARLVSFGADYIHCNRQLSDAAKSILRHTAEDRFGGSGDADPYWWDRETWRMAQELTFA